MKNIYWKLYLFQRKALKNYKTITIIVFLFLLLLVPYLSLRYIENSLIAILLAFGSWVILYQVFVTSEEHCKEKILEEELDWIK